MGCFDGTGVNSENYKGYLGQWISVKDQLPGRIGKYLVFFIRDVDPCQNILFNGSFKVVRWEVYSKMNGSRYGWAVSGISRKQITHWMPLPEPPK